MVADQGTIYRVVLGFFPVVDILNASVYQRMGPSWKSGAKRERTVAGVERYSQGAINDMLLSFDNTTDANVSLI